MQPISYDRHRFPPEVIRHAIWLYARFTLSYRDVEELLAERGFDVSYETVRRWVLKFGPAFARNLRRLRPRPADTWHLDEMVVSISGRRMYLWRAVDSEGEILDLLVQPKRDKAAALRLMRKLLRKQGYAPRVLVTDRLRSYAAARRHLGLGARHEQGLRKNNRAENSHQVVCGSNRRRRLSAFCRSTLRSTTPSICNATLSPAPRSAGSEPRLPSRGRWRPWLHEDWPIRAVPRPRSLNVTVPLDTLLSRSNCVHQTGGTPITAPPSKRVSTRRPSTLAEGERILIHSVGIGDSRISAQLAVVTQLLLIQSPDALPRVRNPG
jgi:putative transposase